MRKRAAMLCSAAIALAGTLTGGPASAVTDAPRAVEAVDAVGPAQAATLAWKDCGTANYPTLQCASLKVPLDHDRPHGRTISLALSRVPHTAATSQGPLLVNPGGPGGSGLSLAGFVASSLPASVAAQYDVIGFDPRGVGASQPALDCSPGYFTPARPDSLPTTAALEKANLRRAKSFAASCGKKYKDLLPYIDTVSAVRDMDSIRQALGARKINYFGYSYGTYLGSVYATLFPNRVRRFVLDSIVDPTGVWYEDNIQQDYAFNERHRAFMAWVAQHNATYKLGTDPDKVEAAWYRMRAELAKKPAGGTVGASELEDTFLPGGYYNGYWPFLAEAFASYVNDKDAQPLVETYQSFGAIDASGDNGYSVYTSVQCRDTRWPSDWNQWREDNWSVYAKAPFMTWNNAWYNAPCAFWPTRSLHPVDVGSSHLPPVLLFQATDDAATPYHGGVKMHHLLRGSSLVVEDGGGNHGITLSGNSCLDQYLSAYLTDGTVPRGSGEADAVCRKLPDPEPQSAEKTQTAKLAAVSGSASGAAAGTATGTASVPAYSVPASSKGATLHGLLGFRN